MGLFFSHDLISTKAILQLNACGKHLASFVCGARHRHNVPRGCQSVVERHVPMVQVPVVPLLERENEQ